MSNFREMAPQWLQNGCLKNFKILKYEHIIYHFKARGLGISNIQLLSRTTQISRFNEHFKKFREICFAHIFAKVIIYSKSLDHVL